MSIKKLARMLFLVNTLQFVLGLGILLALRAGWLSYSKEMLTLSVCVILVSSLLSLAEVYSLIRYQRKYYAESLENLEQLNLRLREQRHDYLNQMQVVHGLLELGEFESARDYLEPVFRDIMKVSRALKTAQPAVNALLQAKLEAAERQGIDFYLEVGTQLGELSVEPWELCKILANLIDNAVTAVGQREGEKQIRLQIGENRDEYLFRVQNNGPEIPQAQRKLIFGPGFTTKTGEGHGMGLAIVASALKEAGGSICVESGPEATSFLFSLPKRADR